MRRSQGILAAASSAALLGAGLVARQVWGALHRPDLPSFSNQDISGAFGDPSLPPFRIVAVGDSSLTAPGIDDLDDVWLRRLAHRYTDRHRLELTSLGVGGSRAADVVNGQLTAAVRLRADLAVVSVGGNDVIWGVPVRRYARHLEAIVSGLAPSPAYRPYCSATSPAVPPSSTAPAFGWPPPIGTR
jgi:lysophospholipase L1-like esterase